MSQMSEIEKAREALFTHMLSVQAADDFLRKFESFSRAIAREEIEAHEDRLMHEAMHGEINQEGGDPHSTGIPDRSDPAEDNSPPAVEAPAAGDCPHCDGTGLFRGGRAAVQMPKCPRCYGSGQAEDVGPRNAVEAGADDDDIQNEIRKRARIGVARIADNPRTTALARRLAEALRTSMHDGPLEAEHYREIAAALTEARKAGLIE